MTDKVTIGNAAELSHILKGRDYASFWASPEAFSRHIRGLKKSEAWHDSGWDGDQDFSGTKNMDEALDLAENGWKEGVEKVEKARSRILALNPIKPRLAKYDVVGVVPSVPRAVAGDIKSMKAPHPDKAKKKPVITLISDMSCPWFVSTDVLCNRAAVIAAMVDQIEACGYSVEVVSVSTSQSGKDFTVITGVVVKDSHQPVDTSRLAFGLGHASLFRRMVFADWGSHAACKKLGFGLGHGGKGFKDDEELFKEKGVYHLPQTGAKPDLFKTEDEAATKGVQYLMLELQKQGCPAFPKLSPEEIAAKEVELFGTTTKKIPGFGGF